MHPHLSPDPTTRTTPSRRSRPRAAGVVLATLLLLVLAQPPSTAYGRQQSSAPAVTVTASMPGVAWSLSEAPAPSEATPRDHHADVAGIPAPLVLAVGAVLLVLVILLAITALTRHRGDGDDAFLDLER
ncbi:hypothetical protein [Promicromonospora soli]